MIDVFTRQSPSQFGLNELIVPRCEPPRPDTFGAMPLVCPSPDTWPSYSMPIGLVPKTNAFWLSLKVSSTMMIASVSLRSASRRFWLTTIFEGSESKQITPM